MSDARWNLLAKFMILALKYMYWIEPEKETQNAMELVGKIEKSIENAQ